MTKTFLRTLSAIIAAVMILGTLSLAAFAVTPDEFDDAKIATENFTVHFITDDQTVYYKFIPQTTGFYHISSEYVDEYITITLFNSSYTYLDGCTEYEDFGRLGVLWQLTAGETYFYSINVSDADYFPIDVDFSVLFYGTLDNMETVNVPYKNKYINGIDVKTYSGEPYIDTLSLEGLCLELKFSTGNVFEFYGDDVRSWFAVNQDNSVNSAKITIENSGIVFAEFEVEIIENPVSSIEIVKVPDKDTYDFYFSEGEITYNGKNLQFIPRYDMSGLEVKINYTNGTSKNVVFGKYSSIDIEGYEMSVMHADYNRYANVGDEGMIVSFLNREAEFNLKIQDVGPLKKLENRIVGYMIYILRLTENLLSNIPYLF